MSVANNSIESFVIEIRRKMIALYLVAVVMGLLLILGVYERTTAMYKAAVQLKGPGILLPIIGNCYVVLRYTASKCAVIVLNVLVYNNVCCSLRIQGFPETSDSF